MFKKFIKLNKYIHLLMSVLLTLLIIKMSLENGEVSTIRSNKFTDIFDLIFNTNLCFLTESIKYKINILFISKSFLTRKIIGHYLLFLVLSYFVTMTLYLFKKNIYFISFIYGLLIAIISEALQMIPIGRNPSINDVLINYSGYLTFIVMFSFFVLSKQTYTRIKRTPNLN